MKFLFLKVFFPSSESRSEKIRGRGEFKKSDCIFFPVHERCNIENIICTDISSLFYVCIKILTKTFLR